MLPNIERLFGIRQVSNSDRVSTQDNPAMLWSHKLRGFRERSWDPLQVMILLILYALIHLADWQY